MFCPVFCPGKSFLVSSSSWNCRTGVRFATIGVPPWCCLAVLGGPEGADGCIGFGHVSPDGCSFLATVAVVHSGFFDLAHQFHDHLNVRPVLVALDFGLQGSAPL